MSRRYWQTMYKTSYRMANIFTIFLLSIYIYTYYNINIYFWHRNWKSVSKTRIFNTLFLTMNKCNSFILKGRYNSILLLGQFSRFTPLSLRFANALNNNILVKLYAYHRILCYIIVSYIISYLHLHFYIIHIFINIERYINTHSFCVWWCDRNFWYFSYEA